MKEKRKPSNPIMLIWDWCISFALVVICFKMGFLLTKPALDRTTFEGRNNRWIGWVYTYLRPRTME